MRKSGMLRGYLYVIASAVIFGCMPLMTKLIYAEGANPMTVVALRNALALPLLAVMAYKQSGSLRIQIRQIPMLTTIAVLGCCITPVLLFSSYDLISSGTATVIHFIYPAVVVVGGVLCFRHRIKGWDLLSVIICVAGISLFYVPGELFHWQGAALALASGITFAAYVLLLSVFRRGSMTGLVLSFYVVLISAVCMFAICLLTGQLAFPNSLRGWLLSVLFAFSVSAGAVVLFQQGTILIGGQRASILSTLEPITGVIIGAAVFDEPMNWRTILGSAMVIAAAILIAVKDAKNKSNST